MYANRDNLTGASFTDHRLKPGSIVAIPAHQTVPNFGYRAYGLEQGFG